MATAATPIVVDDAPDAREAEAEGARILAGAEWHEVRITNDPGAGGCGWGTRPQRGCGVLVPAGASVNFVCVDDLPANCWQIGDETAEPRLLTGELYTAVVVG